MDSGTLQNDRAFKPYYQLVDGMAEKNTDLNLLLCGSKEL